MTSFDYRLNPLYTIKECSSCGALYTTDYCCSNRSLVDKIICDLNKASDSPHLHTFSSNQRHCFQCKDVLGDGEFCQRCTCMRCESGLSKRLCLICGNNQNSLNDSPSIFENSSQSPPHINHYCCYECGDPLDGIFCTRVLQKNEEEEKQIAEEQAAKALYWKIPICYDDDKQQTHMSQTSGSGADERTSSIPGVPDAPTDESEEELSWNSTDDEGTDNEGMDGDDNEEDEGDDGEEGDGDDDDEDDDGKEGNDDDDDQEVERDDEMDDEEEGGDDDQEYDGEYAEETRDEESFDPIPKTPKNSEDEGNGEDDIGLNVGGEEGHVEEEEEDKLYKDVNINQERGIQATLEVKDSHVTLTLVNPDGQQQSLSVSSQFVTSMLNPTLDVGMESIFETTSQMDVQNPASVAPLPMTAPIMTPSTIATITTTSQAPILPTTALSFLIQNLPNFGSLFGFDNRLRTLEANFSEAMQTNQFAGASDHLRDEAQRENDEFLKAVDENMQKIIKEQVKEQVKVQVSKILPRIKQTVNEQLEAEILTRSSHSSRTSYVVAADLSEMELKKILIKKMEGNKSIQRSDEQRNLYKALVEAYESDKIILDTYGENVTLKRRRDDDADKDEEPSAGPDRGSKRRREGKEPESISAPTETATRSAGRSTQGSRSRQASSSESALAEEPMQTTFKMDEPSHLEFDTGAEDQPIVQSSQHPKWFSQQHKPPTPDRDWNKTIPATHESIQPWISELAKRSDSRSSFNELMDTPLDFSNFLINRLKVDTLTPELLPGPTYELMKGSCKILVELEYHLEEVFKATTYQLDWVNPEGQQYPHNLLKTLPLIPNNRDRRVIPFEHFINNELEYLRGGASSCKYTTSITKTKATDYGHIKWIEDLVPRTMWIEEPIGYVKESARDVYSKRRIITVTEIKIVEWHSYKHLDWITVRRDDDKLYKFKEGDFKRLRIQDIEDMLLLLVQGKLTNLTVEERFAFNVSLRMFTRSIVIQRRVEDLQLGNKDKKNRLMQIDELYKFSDGTLTDVRTALDDRLKGIQM
uniref:Uncharacterized protein n=1 Tax=Tanacetum cinerariifolium TaxID=118510 RepID=A0A6L2J9J3_TANCI|nr:hypothetical protein [Tanacetum cinerariifolium]